MPFVESSPSDFRMDQKYAAWIEDFLLRCDPYGRCSEATLAMVKLFPELRRACGFYHCAWGPRQHWWCVDAQGNIIDPTVTQFPPGEYQELGENDPKPKGKCMNCGDYCYDDPVACSPECKQELRVAYGGPNG